MGIVFKVNDDSEAGHKNALSLVHQINIINNSEKGKKNKQVGRQETLSHDIIPMLQLARTEPGDKPWNWFGMGRKKYTNWKGPEDGTVIIVFCTKNEVIIKAFSTLILIILAMHNDPFILKKYYKKNYLQGK